MIKNVNKSSCEISIFLVRFQLQINSLDKFPRNTQISYFVKIRIDDAELFHMGR